MTFQECYLHQIADILRSEHHSRDQNNRVDHQHKIVYEKFEKVSKFVRGFVEDGHQYDATDEENLIIAGHRSFCREQDLSFLIQQETQRNDINRTILPLRFSSSGTSETTHNVIHHHCL